MIQKFANFKLTFICPLNEVIFIERESCLKENIFRQCEKLIHCII